MRRVAGHLLLGIAGLIGLSQNSFAVPANGAPNRQSDPQSARQSARQTFGPIPLAFEPNAGQTDSSVKFLVHRPGISAGFGASGIDILLPGERSRTTRVGINFPGGQGQLDAEKILPGKTNYLHGNDPAKWHTGIANFAQLRYSHLWPGIDLVFYGNGEHLEHDLVVAPGADPGRIAFDLRGAQSVEATREGDLLVHVGDGLITFKKPVAYQETASGRKQIASDFKVDGRRISFRVGRYDHRRALTIDPVLVFSTLLVGSTFDSVGPVAVDAQGNIYVAGETNSTDFPVTASAEQPTCNKCSGIAADAFITKLSPTGTALVYSTFLGGSDQDEAHSIGVDSNGNAVISGITLSSDFPAVKPIGAFTSTDIWHMFVASLSPTGSTLNYSGIVGPLNALGFSPQPSPFPSSIFVPLTVDSAGNAYATVQTVYASFPTTPSAIAPVPPNPKAAILVAMKIAPTGSFVYSTAIPGVAAPAPPGNFGAPGPNTFFQNAIAVDSAGSAYIAGQANDGLPTTLGVIGPSFASDSGFFVFFPQEGFVLKLNPAGTAITYATYVPGTSKVSSLRVDGSGNAYLGGITSSPLLPVSSTGFQKDPGCTGCQANFLLKLNPQATAAPAGTYLRGAPRAINDAARLAHIAIDTAGHVYATGLDAQAVNFPMKNPLEQLLGGFVIELSNDLSTLLFSTGGPDAAIEISSTGKVILASDAGYPPTPGAFQTAPPAARGDLFALPNVAAIDLTVPAPAVCLSPRFLNFGSGVVAPGTTSAPQSSTLTNCGNGDLHISSVASDSPDYGASTTCALAPAALTAGSTCTVSATYSPVDYKTGNIVITDDALASPHSVGLSGFPKAPATTFSPTSLTFLETPITTSVGLSITIINSGTLPLTIASVSTTGDFSASQNCVGVTIPVFVFVPPIGGPPNNVCVMSVFFSPTNSGTRMGTLIVKDNALDSPHIVKLQGLGLTAWPTPAVANGTSAGEPGISSVPQILALPGSGFSRVTTAILDGIPFDNLSRLITVASPQELDLTLSDNDFGDVGEVPVKVITPAPGGGTSNTVATIYSPVQITDFTSRNIEFFGVGQIVKAPISQFIYTSIGNNLVSPDGKQLVDIPAVDPSVGRLVGGIQVYPHTPTTIAISDDNQFMYVALIDVNSVAQISIATGKVNFIASLGADASLGNYNATAIRVLPGQPHTWVAALQPVFDTVPEAVKVFDDATPRGKTVEHGHASSIFPGKLLFVGGDTSTLYAIDSSSMYRFSIDATGITFKDKTASLGAVDFDTDGSLLYLSTGAIIDPATLANKGNFALPPGLAVRSLVVDGANSRAIFSGDGPPLPSALAIVAPPSLIQAFNTKTLAAAGQFEMPATGAGTILRWGTNGLAVVTEGGLLDLTRSSITGVSGLLAPFHIGANFGTAPIPLAQVSAGQSATYQIGIVGVNGFNGPVTLSCENLPPFASCSFSQSTITPGSGQVTVTIATHQSGTASNIAPRVPGSGKGFIALAGLAALPFALAWMSRRRKWLALCMLMLLIGCGGGGSQIGGPPPPPPTPTPPTGSNTPIGIYTVVLTGTSSAGTRHANLPLRVL
jgi:hypothetical protein